MNNKVVKELLDWLFHLGSAALLAVLVVVFVGRLTVVDGNSMLPTLKNQDVLIIESLSQRFGSVEAGDIVVLKIPELLSDHKKYAIKRVIAVENQHVVIKNGKVYVDEKLLAEPYINGETTLISNELYDDVVVPQGCVYVLGDNRLPDKSMDSRAFGTVSAKKIIGTVLIRIFPFSDAGRLP